MPLRSLLCAIIVLGATATQALAGHAEAELLSDVSAIQPGKPFWLGVRLSIDPGWHVYWKNPGDAGLPTRVKLSLPDGFTADPLEFPTPRRFEQPGNIVVFGYENSVVLLTKVTPPPNLPANFQGQFHAAVTWLVCSDICIPGKAALDLTLGTSPQSSSANPELFDDWIAQLPDKSAANPKINVDVSASPKVVATIIWDHPAPDGADFFPEAPDDYYILDTKVKSAQNTTVVSFIAKPLAGQNPGATTLQAVLGYFDKDGKRRGLIFSVALPARADNNH
jgi:DsbC/DsbD-like thiol-disulfide interchange protein